MKHCPLCLLVLFVVLVAQACAESPRALKTYRDPAHGVRFTYPAMWELSDGMSFYLGTAILTTANGPVKAIAAVGFCGGSGEGYQPYPNTNLSGIQFAYTVRSTADQASCEQIAKDNTEEAAGKSPERYEVIHGVRYLHVAGGDGGLGHGVDSDIYATYRTNQCFLFEGDIHTIAPGIKTAKNCCQSAPNRNFAHSFSPSCNPCA